MGDAELKERLMSSRQNIEGFVWSDQSIWEPTGTADPASPLVDRKGNEEEKAAWIE